MAHLGRETDPPPRTALIRYHDRSRIIDAHRGLSVDGARVVLVDGRVAATWSVRAGTVIVTPAAPPPVGARYPEAEGRPSQSAVWTAAFMSSLCASEPPGPRFTMTVACLPPAVAPPAVSNPKKSPLCPQ